MTSNITNASQDELTSLIYHHLKENGYQKAAHVLRKLAPQVETEEVKVSLREIFQKWASSDDGEIPPVPSGVQTPEIQSPAKGQTKSKITAPSAEPHPKTLVGINKTSASLSKSKKQTKNKTVNKLRKRKESSSEDVSPLPSAAAAPGNDSDSDSSLDVDKWRKMLSVISDADREKMDVLSILDESSGIMRRERAKRKPRKKKESQDDKAKSDSPTKKATDESSDVSITAKTRSRKPKSKTVEVSKDITPSTSTGSERDSRISGLDVVETPKTTKAKTTSNSFDWDDNNNAEERHETNTPLERTKKFAVLDSEAVMTPKRVHFQADNSFALQVEASACENNGTLETSTDAPAKKAKKKKRHSDAETGNSTSNVHVAVETHCEETNLTTDRSETPSKKVKSKKSKSVVDPVANETPSKKDKARKTEIERDQGTSESVNSDSYANLSETAFKEPVEVETPSEIPKTITSDADLLQSDSTNSSSKKRKRKLVADAVEIQQETPVESNASQDERLGNELESSSQEPKTHKRKKHKREEACDVPEPTKNNEEDENALQPEEEEEAPAAMSQKKKKKKKEKERGEQTEEMVPDEAPVEEAVVHKKKKKSSKEKRLSIDEAHGLSST